MLFRSRLAPSSATLCMGLGWIGSTSLLARRLRSGRAWDCRSEPMRTICSTIQASGCRGQGHRFNSVYAPTRPVRVALGLPSEQFKRALRPFGRLQLAVVRCNSALDSPSDKLPWDGGYPPSQVLLRRALCGSIWSWNEGLRSFSAVQPERG